MGVGKRGTGWVRRESRNERGMIPQGHFWIMASYRDKYFNGIDVTLDK